MADLTDALALGAGPVATFVNWWTLEIRVVVAVRRQLAKRGIRLDNQALRQVMYSPAFQALLADPEAQGSPELIQALAETLLPPHAGDLNEAAALRDLLLIAFRSRLRGSTPASEFKELLDDSRTARIIQSIDDQSNDDGLFEYRLNDMHPLRAFDFREIRAEWPQVTRLLGSLETSPDRLTLMRRWAAHGSPFLASAPPAIWCLLGDLAADAGANDLAVQLIGRAITEGVELKPYWMMRLLNLRGIKDIEEATEFLSEVRGHPLVEATLHANGAAQAIQVLEEWAPVTRREDVHKRLLLAQIYLGSLRIDEALETALKNFREFDSTGSALIAARTLTTRQMVDSSLAHRNDLSDALALTVQARAKRRVWGIDAGDALAFELRIRRMLSDYRGALDLATGAGDFPAIATELKHPEVIAEVAKLHAERGDILVAKRMLGEAPAHRRAHISALIAEHENRDDDAVVSWAEALEATDDYGDKADIAFQLALHGHRSAFLDVLKVDNAEIARELEMTVELFGHRPGALERFRGFANEKYRGTQILYIYFREEGNSDEAGRVARQGAQRWSDPDLWIESAKYLYNSGRPNEAIADIHAALAAAPENWGGRRASYRQLVEAFSHLEDWREARNAAAQLLAEEPENPSAVWALVYCHVRVNDLPAALRTWLTAGSPEPDGELQVGAWIELLAEYGEEVGSPRDALKIANRYPDDERIRRALISVLFIGARPAGQQREDSDEEEPDPTSDYSVPADEAEVLAPDPDRDAFQEMLADYQRDFPGAPFFKPVVYSEEDPLASMQAAFGDAPDNSELEEQIQSGILPIGFAAEITGRSYLEVLTASDYGPVYAGTGDIASDRSSIDIAAERGAVVDLSAVVTIARLPEEVRSRLIGQFPGARVLVEHQRDAKEGARAISRDSGLSFHPGRGTEPPRLVKRTSEELADRSNLASAVVASLSQFVAESHPSVASIKEFVDQDFDKAFLLSVDFAHQADVPIWADDQALRGTLRSAGGTGFGTPELLFMLREQGEIAAELLDTSEAILVSRGYSGVRFRQNVWDLASSIGSSPFGVINAIRYGGNDQVVARAAFAFKLADKFVGEPFILGAVVRAIAQWLVGIASNEETATQNMVVLARQLLSRMWMNSSTLPYCVSALRDLPGKVDAHSVLLKEIYREFESLSESEGAATAATAIFELVGRLDPEDGLRVRSAVLARRFE